jgi:hypothetical protein
MWAWLLRVLVAIGVERAFWNWLHDPPLEGDRPRDKSP